MKRTVVVLNQFALPRTEAGGTRHVDLFGRLQDWYPVIIAASHNHTTGERFTTDDPRFRLVSTPRYQGNGPRRIAGWISYAAKASWRALRETDVDVVYASSPQLLTFAAGRLVARLRGVPLVVEVRDLWPESMVSSGHLRPGSTLHRLLTWLEVSTYRRADRIVTVVDWGPYFKRLGIPGQKVVVIANGCDPEDFLVAEDQEILRDRLGIHKPTAVFAGSHGVKDGIGFVVDAAAELPDVHFLLFGDGADKAPQMERAQSMGLRNIEFRDAVAKNELARVLRACDIGVHTVTPLSVFELGMSPNKLFDYVACGLPVVSNARGPLRGIIEEGQCGAVTEPTGLAGGISRVLGASAEQRAHWVAAGSCLLRERFSRQAQADQLKMVLDAVLPGDSGREKKLFDVPEGAQ